MAGELLRRRRRMGAMGNDGQRWATMGHGGLAGVIVERRWSRASGRSEMRGTKERGRAGGPQPASRVHGGCVGRVGRLRRAAEGAMYPAIAPAPCHAGDAAQGPLDDCSRFIEDVSQFGPVQCLFPGREGRAVPSPGRVPGARWGEIGRHFFGLTGGAGALAFAAAARRLARLLLTISSRPAVAHHGATCLGCRLAGTSQFSRSQSRHRQNHRTWGAFPPFRPTSTQEEEDPFSPARHLVGDVPSSEEG